ncbi:MAG: adenosine kinase, partial [Pseudomonadota bacterium]
GIGRAMAVGLAEAGANIVGVSASLPASGGAVGEEVARARKVHDIGAVGGHFAGGFMYGHARGMLPAECARLGALAAAEVIAHFGARPQTDLRDLALTEGFAV